MLLLTRKLLMVLVPMGITFLRSSASAHLLMLLLTRKLLMVLGLGGRQQRDQPGVVAVGSPLGTGYECWLLVCKQFSAAEVLAPQVSSLDLACSWHPWPAGMEHHVWLHWLAHLQSDAQAGFDLLVGIHR